MRNGRRPSPPSSVRYINVGQEIRFAGRAGLTRRFNCAVDQGGDLGIDRVERRHVEQCRLADAPAEMLQAVTLVAQSPHLVLAAIELGVARVVAVKAAGVDLDGARSAAGASAFDRLPCRVVYGKEVVAIDLDGRQAEPGRSSGDVMAADGVADAGAFPVLVVLEHK